MIVSRQSADNRKWMAIDFCPKAEFLILIRGQFSVSCLRQCDEENFLWPLCSNWVTPGLRGKVVNFDRSNEAGAGKSHTTRKRPLVIYWILNPFNQVRTDLWWSRAGGSKARLASVVLYFPPSFLNFGNSLAAPVNFDVARVEIIMIKYSSNSTMGNFEVPCGHSI